MIIESDVCLENLKCDYCNEKATFLRRKLINFILFFSLKTETFCTKHRPLKTVGKKK